MREILTRILDQDGVLEELRFFVEHFRSKGFESCEIVFGFAWGIEYYPSNVWPKETVPLDQLEKKIRNVEAKGLGSLGYDDLFAYVSDFEFRFCNDTDVHISFENSNEELEYFYSRWESLGYEPSEWIKNEKNGPGEMVRSTKARGVEE